MNNKRREETDIKIYRVSFLAHGFAGRENLGNTGLLNTGDEDGERTRGLLRGELVGESLSSMVFCECSMLSEQFIISHSSSILVLL